MRLERRAELSGCLVELAPVALHLLMAAAVGRREGLALPLKPLDLFAQSPEALVVSDRLQVEERVDVLRLADLVQVVFERATLLLFAIGMLASSVDPLVAPRICGVAWLGLALWMARWDLARRSLRRKRRSPPPHEARP